MEKKQIIIIAVAAILIAAVAIGLVMHFSNSANADEKPITGLLLVHGALNYEWIPMETIDISAVEAFYAAFGISPLERTTDASNADINNWTLWVLQRGASNWTSISLADAENVILSDYDGVAWSFGAHPSISRDASGVSLFTMAGTKNRIVCLSAGITEMTAAIAGDSIVGVDAWSTYPTWIEQRVADGTIRHVGGYWTAVSFEDIVAVRPDLVIMDGDVTGQETVINRLRESGITVLVVSGHRGSIDSIRNDLLMIGLVTQNMDTANAINADMVDLTEKLTAYMNAHPGSGSRILIMMPPWGNNVWVAGQGGVAGSALETLGLVNALDIRESWANPTIESISISNPDIVIVMGLHVREEAFTYEELLAHPILGEMEAIQAGRVAILSDRADDIMSRSGPAVIYALGILCYLATLNWDETSGGVYIGNDYMEHLRTLGIF